MQLLKVHPDRAGSGTVVTLTLEDMPAHANEDNTRVYLGGHQLTVDLVDAANGTVQVLIGRDERSGTFTVQVKGGPRGGGNPGSMGYVTAEGAQLFTVLDRDKDILITMRTLTPSTAAAGDSVTINGENLHLGKVFKVGTTVVQPSKKTETQLRFTVPEGLAARAHRLSLSDASGEFHYCPRTLTIE